MLGLVRSSAAARPSLRALTRVGLRPAFPAAITLQSAMQQRMKSTERISPAQAQEILVAQRKNRPLSPDLAIYKPQLTWMLSGLHRLTGIALWAVLYGSLMSYALLPLVGLPFTFAGVAAVVGGLPLAVKLLGKLVLSAPFAFHSWNGVRHLIWDTASALTLKGVYQTGYTVLGLSAVTIIGLLML